MWFTGTPRIGKSVFLGYVAERLKEEGIEFVVTTGNEWYTKHYERKCYSELEDDFKNRSVVHLIDPGDNPPILGLQRHEAFAIFFASPTISNINPYHQKELCTLFMPLWSRNEMEDCCTTLETPFNEDIFNRWGGVFIDSFRDKMLEDQLDRILQSSILRDILSNLHCDALNEPVHQHQWLLHRYPIENYRRCEIQLPSPYVARKKWLLC